MFGEVHMNHVIVFSLISVMVCRLIKVESLFKQQIVRLENVCFNEVSRF